ncbi:unnamed protein product [Ectocarpus sp. 6 AP-2014]
MDMGIVEELTKAACGRRTSWPVGGRGMVCLLKVGSVLFVEGWQCFVC